MSETDIAHFILTGRKRKSSETFGNVSAQGTLLTLGLAGANQPAAELAQKFGITDFQISAENGEAGLETTVGGYLTPRLYVSYGTLIKEKSNTVTLRYHLTPRLVVEAVSGFSSALDFIYNFSVD
jgi:translocation and assembly module TamB